MAPPPNDGSDLPDGKSDNSEQAARRLAGQSGYVFFGSISGKLIRFASVVIITSLISPTIFGIYTLAISIVTLLSKVSDLGLDLANDYYIPKLLSNGEYGRAKFILLFSLSISLLSGALLSIIVYFQMPSVISTFNEPELSNVLLIVLVAIPLMSSSRTLYTAFNSIGKAQFSAVSQNILNPSVQIVISVCLIFLGYPILGLSVGYVMGYAISFTISIILIYESANFIHGAINRVPIGNILSYSVPLLGAGIIYGVLGQIDYFAIAYFDLPTKAVGIYSTAYLLSSSLLIFLSSIGSVFKPMVMGTNEELAVMSEYYQMATKWTVILTLPPAIVLILNPRMYLQTLFSSEYGAASLALTILVIGYLLSVLSGPEGKMLEALNLTKLSLWNAIVMLIINISLDIILIPRLGIVGAAIGTAAAVIASSIIGMLEVYYWSGIIINLSQLSLILLCGLLAYFVGIVANLIFGTWIYFWVLSPFIIVVFYFVFLYLFVPLSKYEKSIIDSTLNRILNVWE